MPYPRDIKQKFDDLKSALHSSNRTNLHLKANGGNTILFIYSPEEEYHYLNKLKEDYPDGLFIDISQEIVSFLDDITIDTFEQLYKEYGPSRYQLFKSGTNSDDLFSRVINRIKEAEQLGKIPFLIRTGAFYGTSIDNHMIMDDKTVRELSLPLVVFYPATFIEGNLTYLNFKLSSHYRSQIIL